MSELPRRPRLADHVVPRLHVVDGERVVLLHDRRKERLARIGEREWGLIAAADGTREVEGIVVAAARAGARATVAGLREFLEDLHAAEWLAPGEEPPAKLPAEGNEARKASKPRHFPLRRLPGFRLSCDGLGGCCRQYGTTLLSAAEVARARVFCPEVLDGGEDAARVFAPERGSVPTGGVAVTMVDGRCAYLGGDGRCAIHVAGGADAKPIGCRTYPGLFAFDGQSVRVCPSVECACVLVSAAGEGGEPLLAGAESTADIDPSIHLEPLAASTTIAPGLSVAGPEYVVFCDAFVAAIEAAPSLPLPEVLWTLADGLQAGTAPLVALDLAVAAPAPIPAVPLEERLTAIGARVTHRLDQDRSWRSSRDLVLRALGWLHESVLARLRGDALGATASPAEDERFYLRSLAFGLHLETSAGLAESLRDRAVRLLLARSFPARAAAEDSAASRPLALVEALFRGQGIGSYAEAFER
jgi:lysine-N-methylase